MQYIKYKLFISGILLFILTGCDFLDVDESSDYTKEDVLESYSRVKALATNVYSYLPYDFCNTEGAMLDAATDDAVHVYESSAIQRFVNGTWSPNYVADDTWTSYYFGIRSANFYLTETEGLIFEDWIGSDNYENWMKNFGNFKYEVRFLRAFFYFELVKRYQNVPLLTKVLELDEVNNQKPATKEEILDFILTECTEVAKELPVDYDGFPDKEFGRITKGAALAFKSRVTLYMASPLYSSDNKEKWKTAAKAAYELIGQASDLGYRLTTYASLFNETNNTNAENILVRPTGENTTFEAANYPMGAEGGRTSTCPTENLVESYEMIDGSSFNWNNPQMRSNPYANRDPRLAFTVAYNTMVWPYDKPLEIWEGGTNGLPITNATSTGYYLKKYVNNTIVFQAGTTTQPKKHNWILFRYAEVLLNYAEAMVNAFDSPDYKDADLPMSAYEAIDLIRKRSDVNMPSLPTGLSAAEFLKRVKNERRVELAFEGHRFWDLRRWKELDEMKNVYGVKIQKNGDSFTYEKFLLSTRDVSDKMYFYPISNFEMYANTNLIQNTGW